MGALDGRVAIITGAGRGLGREHALLFAQEGAKVVVNDLGGARDGTGADATPAQEVVAEIEAMGGEAVVNSSSASDWDAAGELVAQAVDTFGRLDVLVNNAGILRDRMLFNMQEAEWDAVVDVHLKGHAAPLHHAATYWRGLAKAGETFDASVINTSSTSGLLSNPGQANYGAAKTGIATLTEITAKELVRYGVRVNAICPAALTRLTADLGGPSATEQPDDDGWKAGDPANVSPWVAYLASSECRITGKVFFVRGGNVSLFQPYTAIDHVAKEGKWTVEELAAATDHWADIEFDNGREHLGF
jgi:NAD(P)-dependent dehydrogenase (short-subunit alcohol dehydrogenase family)